MALNRLLATEVQPLGLGQAIIGGMETGRQETRQNRLMDLQERQLASQERRYAQQDKRAEIDDAIKQAPIIGKVLEGATTPELWEQGKAILRDQYKIDTTNMPAFSPETHASVIRFAREPEKFGAPTQAVGPDGKPTLLQIGDRGTARPVQGGYAPPQKFGAPAEVTGPDGKPTLIQTDDQGNIRPVSGPYAPKSNLLTPAELAQKKDIAAAGKPSMDVKIDTKAGEGLVKLDVKTIEGLEEGARRARSTMPKLDVLEGALKKFDTGYAGDKILALKQIGQRMGFKVDGISEGELIQSIASQLAPQQRPEGSGSSSDTDVRMFLDSLPNLLRSPGGNRLVIANLRAAHTRQVEEAAFARKYFRENDNSLEGVSEAMDKHFGPLFPRMASPAEAEKLPVGTLYFKPDGEMVVR